MSLLIRNEKVGGSIPLTGTSFNKKPRFERGFLFSGF